MQLPKKIRQRNQRGKANSGPEPWPCQTAPCLRECHAREKPNDEKQYAIFIEQRDPGQNSDPEPDSFVAGLNKMDKKPRNQCPQERIERIHRKQMRKRQEDRATNKANEVRNIAQRPPPACGLTERPARSWPRRPTSATAECIERNADRMLKQPSQPCDQWRHIIYPHAGCSPQAR